MSRYHRPRELTHALETLAHGPWTVLAGGTDHYPARVVEPKREDILDITAVPELQGVERTSAGLRIGAAATWRAVLDAELPAACDGLKAAAREVGGQQIQNRGTVGGNLCNASPAADGIPALLSLDAEVELARVGGRRRLPLEEFILGNRRTALERGELLVAIHVPATALEGTGRFLKLGARTYLVISIAMVAGRLRLASDGTIAAVRLAVGACSAAALRLSALEEMLTGMRPEDAEAAVRTAHLGDLTPIDDVRADAPYRLDAARTLVRRCLADLAEAA